MPKICRSEGCQYPVFSHHYCKKHQYLRKDSKYKAPIIKSRSERRAKQENMYHKDISKYVDMFMYCFICGKYMGKDKDVHHLAGRKEEMLNEKKWWVVVHRQCHSDVHNLPLDKIQEKYPRYIKKLSGFMAKRGGRHVHLEML